ncbi:MAG: site-specific DNA-methyltransferase [Nitrospiraceae bacterium]
MSVQIKPLSFITGFHEVRPVSPQYVERIRVKVREIGVKPYPLSVTSGGVLFGGRHRYEAFVAEGVAECLMHISDPASLDREAIELNRASEDALPMTFVDFAELVWRRLDAGETQQAVADAIGWSREAVRNYASMAKIAKEAWAIVGTTIRDVVPSGEDGAVPEFGSGVPFSENLLRCILPLTADQQVELVRRLARGKCQKGRPYGKREFKAEADQFRVGNELIAKACAILSARMAGPKLEAAIAEISDTLRQSIYLDEAVNGNELGPRALRLVQSHIDSFERSQNSKVFIKSLADITPDEIPDESVDAIITDPPYPQEFIALFDELGALAARVLKPGGSLIALVGQSYLPQYIELLSRHLDYHWTIGVHTPGGQAVQLWAKEVNTFWKPALWFTKGKRDGQWQSDFIRTDANNNDKAHHAWGQSEQLTVGLVERGSLRGDTVLDPFLGGGTTGVVCQASGRKFIGIEIDEDTATKAIRRIAEAADA